MLQLHRDTLVEAFTLMKTIRDFEDRVHTEFATGAIPGFVHLYAGEEASAVGVCLNLNDSDYIASTHRGHGHCIAKGCDVDGMMKEIYGRRDGLCGGKGGSMHIADLAKGMMGANGIVGGGPPLVCGAALSAKTLGTGGVAVASGRVADQSLLFAFQHRHVLPTKTTAPRLLLPHTTPVWATGASAFISRRRFDD